MALVEISDLFKSYRDKPVFKGLSLELGEAGVTCLLGPNGAGKSTLFKMLTGHLLPDKGLLKVLGGNPSDVATRRLIGLTPQESEFPSQLKVREILQFVASHYETPIPLDEALKLFFLEPFADKRTQAMSGGERRLLGIACAFIGRPQFAILDEPTVGLDIDRRAEVLKVVREIAGQGTQVLFSTHYLDEAELVGDWIVFLNQGVVIRQGRLAQLQKDLGYVRVSYRQNQSDLEQDQLEGIDNLELADPCLKSVIVQDSDAYIRKLFASGDQVSDLRVSDCSLDEIFRILMTTPTRQPSTAEGLKSQTRSGDIYESKQ